MRKYRIKHINQKPKSDYSSPINKNVSQMLTNQAFQRQIKKFCVDTGKNYLITIGIISALGEGCKKGYGVTRISQKKIAEKTNLHKDTVNNYMKGMEDHGILDLWGNNKKSNGWRATNLTIITCLYEFADRCAYWYRAAINQKNIAIEKAKSLIGLKPMHSYSFNTVDVKTGEISGGKYTIKGKHEDFLTEYSRLAT